jgi:hypothetical protein
MTIQEPCINLYVEDKITLTLSEGTHVTGLDTGAIWVGKRGVACEQNRQYFQSRGVEEVVIWMFECDHKHGKQEALLLEESSIICGLLILV